MKLYYAGQRSWGFGWGTCNMHLSTELAKLCDVECIDVGHTDYLDGVLFSPVNNSDFSLACKAPAKHRFGYAFFEDTNITEQMVVNANSLDVFFVGSEWNRSIASLFGIKNAVLLEQGIDHEVFKPKQQHRNIRIFSGGKWEYRKGQDLVLSAFKSMMHDYPHATLVAAWWNPWPETMETMRESTCIKCPAPMQLSLSDWKRWTDELCEINSIPRERIEFVLTLTPNDTAALYHSTDFGVFPNRCEGGTNLVLMEYMACGKPVIASPTTGQEPIARLSNRYVTRCENSWLYKDHGLQSLKDKMNAFLAALSVEHTLPSYTWQRTAKRVHDEFLRVVG